MIFIHLKLRFLLCVQLNHYHPVVDQCLLNTCNALKRLYTASTCINRRLQYEHCNRHSKNVNKIILKEISKFTLSYVRKAMQNVYIST